MSDSLHDILQSAAGYESVDQARAIVHEVVASYWRHIAGSLPILDCLVAVADLSRPKIEAAAEVARQLARMSPPKAVHRLGMLYAELLPHAHRKATGVFYTPFPIAERLVDLAEQGGIDWTTARILDPAAGGAAFLAPVAGRMARALRHRSDAAVLASIREHLKGWEIDPFAAWLSTVLVEALLVDPISRTGTRLKGIVEVTDSLAKIDEPLEAWDLVIANPPYGRVSLAPEMRSAFARALYGHANTYALFTDLALRLVRRGGLVALVTPTSFLGGEYFKNLRAVIASEADVLAVEFVDDRRGVFRDVLQEAALTVYARRRATRVAIVSCGTGQLGTVDALGDFVLPTDGAAPWLLPRHGDLGALAVRLSDMPTRLSDLGFAISTGPLVWNRRKERIVGTPNADAIPILWAECIATDGTFRMDYARRSGRGWFLPEPGRDDALLVRERVGLVQRTTAKEQARRLVAATMPRSFVNENPSFTVENHVNMVRPLAAQSEVHLETITSIFNTEAIDAAFRCVSGSANVSAYELERGLPLPDRKEILSIQRLIQSGAARQDIEGAVGRCYGMT